MQMKNILNYLFKWPNNIDIKILPWWKILVNTFVVMPLLYIGCVLMWLGWFLHNGYDHANYMTCWP